MPLRFSAALAFAGALLFAIPARAQFQNHGLGLSLGYVREAPELQVGHTFPVPALAVDGTAYVENGFDVGFRLGVAVQQETASSSHHMLVGFSPAFQLRYFLFEDYFRPYVGGNVSFIHFFNDDGLLQFKNFVGLSPAVGFDYFLSDEWSLGASAELTLLVMLNAPTSYALATYARVATHF